MVSSLKNDFIRGYINEGEDLLMRDYCYCDGQYSEHQSCRNNSAKMYRFDPKERGICHGEITSLYFSAYAWKGGPASSKQKFKGVDCQKSDSRGMVLILQGGLHFVSQANPTYQHFGPIFSDPAVLACAEAGKLIVIWCSFNSHSPSTFRKYPHQSTRNGLIFNQQMEQLFQQNGHINLTTIDWMNLTQRAQTSDGVHYLTNANYFKFQQLLVLAELMQNEQMFYSRQEQPVG